MTCNIPHESVTTDQQSSSPFIDNQLWSIKRLAEFLDVPATTIRDWCYKRLIPFFKAGRHVRFRPSDVEKWLSERGVGDGYRQD